MIRSGSTWYRGTLVPPVPLYSFKVTASCQSLSFFFTFLQTRTRVSNSEQTLRKALNLREGYPPKKWKLFMTFAIKRRTPSPPPLIALFFIHVFTLFLSPPAGSCVVGVSARGPARISSPASFDHSEGPTSCKKSSRGGGLLQMIIRRGRPLANNHLYQLYNSTSP